MEYVVGIDVGGTFTDCVLLDESGAVTTGKALSTPPDFWEGVLSSISAAAEGLSVTRSDLLANTRRLVHGTTIAENAIITGMGARVGLITTRGFEDTILIMRVKGRWVGLSEDEITHIVKTDKPNPIVPRRMIEGVIERIDSEGQVVTPLNIDSAERAIRILLDRGAEALAVSLLWSFLNPAHEEAVAALARRLAPEVFVTTGSGVAPYIGEYERTATAALNGYLGNIASRYIASLSAKLGQERLRAPILITQANGGMLRAEAAAHNAVAMVESGPASGVTASRFLGTILGFRNVIATDMGGTTFKVSIIADNVVEYEHDPNLGKYNVRLPKIDVRSIGAGGGSIAYVEEDSGALKVGPRSAGAAPGPVCYGHGGEEPTVTDADLVLGYLNPNFFLGGRMSLNREAAERALRERIARPLGISIIEAAAGVYNIACSQSADLIRKVSIERGHDPRDFVVFAYGGAGPVHAGVYAQQLGASHILVPFTASVHCAMGAVCSDVVREYGQSDPMRFPADPNRFNATFAKLESKARADLRSDGFKDEAVVIRRYVDLKFRRQVHVLRTPVKNGPLTGQDLDELCNEFENTYEVRYGKGSAFRAAGIEITTFIVEGTGPVLKPVLRRFESSSRIPADAFIGSRECYFVDPNDPTAPLSMGDTPVYRLPGLVAGNRFQGPAIVETPVTTIVVQPRQNAIVDEYLNVVIEMLSSREG